MPTNKRITDLTDYTSVLPYASEMFGVYQPMIGWKSKRTSDRLNRGLAGLKNSLLKAFAQNYDGVAAPVTANADCIVQISKVHVGKLLGTQLSRNNDSVLIQSLINILPKDRAPVTQEWQKIINQDVLEKMLNGPVVGFYSSYYNDQCIKINNGNADTAVGIRSAAHLRINKQALQNQLLSSVQLKVNEESALAGALLGMLQLKLYAQLEAIFYKKPDPSMMLTNQQLADLLNVVDPFAVFDPSKDIKSVSLSPLGIVHLFRQYFFELDTFLGTPTGHVWLSPGSTVELIEVSTRRTYTEKVIELATEKSQKTESSTTSQDDISEAVKEENKNDLKLGASLTVNQSWGTGNATATASLNMDNTQNNARETTHKRMRQQTAKLSTEIKENYKSTFKTVTEVTDTSSKRYVLSNPTQELINYELRRKMRQVGVQVQDIGTYLCWETFVDEPGKQLGLANLVHIAKPADLMPQPDMSLTPYPPSPVLKPFQAPVTWDFNDDDNPHPGPNSEKWAFHNNQGFQVLTSMEVPPPDAGYMVEDNFEITPINLVSTSTGDQRWAFGARLTSDKLHVELGVLTGPGGINWDERVDFFVSGSIRYVNTPQTIENIDAANKKIIDAGAAATAEQLRAQKEAFYKAAKERIEFASKINTRKYEDLREEERIIVYRNLISALMPDYLYKNADITKNNQNIPDSAEANQARHTLSELINSIFDVDKMLYFVAPEWWKPRRHYHQYLGGAISNENLTNWADQEDRVDNYYITENSQYAKMGSSLGWLLELDGDDLRNAFLNAPWVKAVIPIRPGKEREAINWLQQRHVEGTDGLDADYQAANDELDKIKAALGISKVTIRDAINYLCDQVAVKYRDSLVVGRHPKEEINDDNRVSATPIDKVYEHGFYPLKDGFRATTSEGYEVFDQWIEVLPTDQVVPVEVKYNPKTGRQI